jgi:uncharacterized protein YjbI with pentapeptide repeats
MANEKHVALLKQGVEDWNKWQRENPDVKGNLSRVDLSGINLSRARLIRADLSGADLFKVVLSKAYLRWANLNGAYPSGT